MTIALPLVASAMQTAIVAPAAAGTDVRLDGLRALVVDDQRDSCELVAMLLERHGAAVVACDSAAQALARLQSGGFDLLIADIAMPDIDGYRLIRDVRARGFTLPAIAFTAYARPDDRRAGVRRRLFRVLREADRRTGAAAHDPRAHHASSIGCRAAPLHWVPQAQSLAEELRDRPSDDPVCGFRRVNAVPEQVLVGCADT